MKSKLLLNAFILLVLFSSVSAVVAAQTDFFSSFDTITGGRDLGEFYGLYASWIDLIIYIFLFIYVAQFGFKNNQSTSGMGKALPTVVGIALAIGAMVAENQFGFNLGQLGSFALGIALLIIAFTVYKAVHGMGLGGASSWAFAYIIVYGFLTSAASNVWKSISERAPLASAFASIILLIAIAYAGIAIFNWAKQGGWGGVNTTIPNAKTTTATTASATQAQQATQRQQQINNALLQINSLQGRLGNVIGNQQLNQQQRIQELRHLMAEIRQLEPQIQNIPP